MLTSKQSAFIDLYIANLGDSPKLTNTEIATKAGYSLRSAHVTASQLLKNPKIRQAIAGRFDESAMSASEVLHHFSRIARGDIKDSSLGDRLRALESLAKYHQLTTTSRVETWRDDAIKRIQDGKIDYDVLQDVLRDMGEPESLADELFRLANVPISS